MNKICVIIDDGKTYDTAHWGEYQPPPNSSEVDPWIIKYFARHKNDHLILMNDTICEIVGKYSSSPKLYVVKDINSDAISSISGTGILIFNENNRKAFFDRIFKK